MSIMWDAIVRIIGAEEYGKYKSCSVVLFNIFETELIRDAPDDSKEKCNIFNEPLSDLINGNVIRMIMTRFGLLDLALRIDLTFELKSRNEFIEEHAERIMNYYNMNLVMLQNNLVSKGFRDSLEYHEDMEVYYICKYFEREYGTDELNNVDSWKDFLRYVLPREREFNTVANRCKKVLMFEMLLAVMKIGAALCGIGILIWIYNLLR